MSLNDDYDIIWEICLEKFVESGPKEPRVLQCGHTYCLTCIESLNHPKSCPECRFPLKFNLYVYPRNMFIVRLIEKKDNANFFFNFFSVEKIKQSSCFRSFCIILNKVFLNLFYIIKLIFKILLNKKLYAFSKVVVLVVPTVNLICRPDNYTHDQRIILGATIGTFLAVFLRY